MTKVGAQVVDLDRVLHAVDGLSAIDKDKAIKAGLRAGEYVFLAGGRRRLKARMRSGPGGVTGNLLKSFSIRVKRAKLGALAGFSTTQSFGKDGGKGYHAHLVDRGTASRNNRKSANRGIMPGNLFWSDTVAQDDTKALDKVYQGIERMVERIKNRI